MNPTEYRGSGLGQPLGGDSAAPPPAPAPQALPQLQPAQAAPTPASAPAQKPASAKEDSFLQSTLHQLNALTRQYAQDPYLQSQEIELLKAAYVAKEFGRTLKVAEY